MPFSRIKRSTRLRFTRAFSLILENPVDSGAAIGFITLPVQRFDPFEEFLVV